MNRSYTDYSVRKKEFYKIFMEAFESYEKGTLNIHDFTREHLLSNLLVLGTMLDEWIYRVEKMYDELLIATFLEQIVSKILIDVLLELYDAHDTLEINDTYLHQAIIKILFDKYKFYERLALETNGFVIQKYKNDTLYNIIHTYNHFKRANEGGYNDIYVQLMREVLHANNIYV